MRKNNVRATVVVLGFLTLLIVGCNKYDKMSILGVWEIDLKEARNLSVDSSKEVLYFNSGSNQTYKQTFYERTSSKWERWTIEGNFERKNNKITFTNRVKDEISKQGDVTYKYRIESDKLILIVEGEGFNKDEKIYTKQ
ncbi:MAG: hypothetical protein LBG80_12905 [Bacteroidales bacterium]|nr:hypothetical protein [Bacteroidales bacterium]